MNEGLLKRLKRGKFIGRPPIGYEIDGSIIEYDAKIVKDIFELSKSMGFDKIRKYLNETYGKIIPKGSLEKIVTNKFFIGIITYGGIEYKHSYKTFITKEQFDQSREARRNRKTFNKDRKKLLVPTADAQMKIDQGLWPARQIFGYRKIGVDFEIVEHEANILKIIMEWYAEGNYSFSDIQQKVKDTFKISISDTTIKYMVKNRFYIGFMRWQGHEYPHRYPLFIDNALFDRCNEMLYKRRINNKIRGDIRENQFNSIKLGKWIQAPPLGYKREKDTIVICPLKSPIIQDVFAIYIQQKGSIAKSSTIIEEKYGIAFTRSKIILIIKNQFYIGNMIYKNEKYPHSYGTFISEETFIQANEISLKNRLSFARKQNTVIKNTEITLLEQFKIDKGHYVHNQPPWGYVNSLNGLIVDGKTADIIRDMFETYAKGNHTLVSLGMYIHHKYSIAKNEQAIRYILKYKMYKGIANCKGVEYKHVHEKIITEELFDRVQEILHSKYHGKPVSKTVNLENPENFKQPESDIGILNICKEARSLDEIMDLCGLEFEQAQSLLLELELEGKINEVGPNMWRTVQ